MLPRIIHIVKRFGCVGGMETYVWRLVHGLSEQGFSVSVICEQVFNEVDSNIEVVRVETAMKKPRWKSMLTFRSRVEMLVREKYQGQAVIIHSHERSLLHHVTTFHGPPIDIGDNLRGIKCLIPRIRAWKRMEREELLAPQVQCVLPVSSIIQEALCSTYPELTGKRIELGWPGVEKSSMCGNQRHSTTFSKGNFVFVGREWKRKGLLRAVEIVRGFRDFNRNSTLDVYGVDSDEVPRAIRELSWARFHGWNAKIPWNQYDVLIHPAAREPFGMVVSEARAQGVAVLMSDRVGASDLQFECVRMVPFDAPLDQWIAGLHALLALTSRSIEVKWTWDDLVDLHSNVIYPQLEVKIL